MGDISRYLGTLHFVTGTLKGLGFGLGINHTNENIIINSVPTGTFILPSRTLLTVTNTWSLPLKQIT